MKKILVVEDDPHHLALIEIVLSKKNYEIIKAGNGIEALEKLRESSPDLIIADIMMPEMDGFELCERVRKEENYKNIPFIFLSALGDIEDRVKGLKLGADDYITKPFSPEELLARIEILLDRYERYRKTMETQVTKGRLEDIPVTDLLQLLYYGKKTAVIEIQKNSNSAKIWIKKGDIVNAEKGKRKGMDALYEIFSWDKGDFELKQESFQVEETIKTSTEETMLEILRQRDEAEKLKEKWKEDMVVVVKKVPEEREEKAVISQKGEKRVKEVLNASPFSEYNTLVLLEELEKKGIIELEKREEKEKRKSINIMVISKNRAERNLFIKSATKIPSILSEGSVNFSKAYIEDVIVNLYGLPGIKSFATLWETFAGKCKAVLILVNPVDAESVEVGLFAYRLLKEKVRGPLTIINTNPTVPLDIKEEVELKICLPSDVRKASLLLEEITKEIIQ